MPATFEMDPFAPDNGIMEAFPYKPNHHHHRLRSWTPDDFAPWNDLEQLKKEANEVAMAYALEDRVVKEDEATEESKPDLLQTSATSFSEYTSFAKTSSGYLYPTKATPQPDIEVSEPHNDESQEHTMENFNQFLEENGHKVIDLTEPTIAIEEESSSSEDEAEGEFFAFEKEPEAKTQVWPERLLRSPELMRDAPSGILLVFDRMLDCIDAGNDPRTPKPPKDLVDVDVDVDDQSSIWSLSIRSSLLRELGGDHSVCSMTTIDDHTLDLGRPPRSLRRVSVEDLGDGLDCFFPCWNDPYEDLLPRKDSRKKRKRDGEEPLGNQNNTEVLEEISLSGDDDNDGGTDTEAPSFRDFEDGMSGSKVPSLPSVLKLHDTIVLETDAEKTVGDCSSSNSSFSELFDGLVFGSPSDEKDGVDELDRFLDRTSVTEATSTLSYSTGTIS